MRDLLSVPAMRPPGSPRTGVPGRLHREAAGERPPRARPQRRGSPGPIPNPAVKPAFAESTAAQGCGRAGRRARGGRFSMLARFRARGDARGRAACAGRGPQGDVAPCGPFLRSAKVAESPAALRALPVPFCAAGSLAGRAYSWTAPLAGFLSLCAASRFSFLLVPKGLIDGYNLKTMYSSLAQCWCMGMRDL